MHLFIGPVGAGKSTLAGRLAHREGAVFLNLDPWMVHLFGADPRPEDDPLGWYMERRARMLEHLWDVATDILRADTSVVVEPGLVTAAERAAFYARVDVAGHRLQVRFVDAPREVRRARVAARNAKGGPGLQIVPMAFFERASEAWEPPDATELNARDILAV